MDCPSGFEPPSYYHVLPVEYCDFEKDLCGWKQAKFDDFDWIQGGGFTSSAGTGPSFDHTRGDKVGQSIFQMLISSL